MADLPALEDECFFIAPIGEDASDTRKRSDGVLRFIVAKAASELGLTAVRADNISKPGQITLQVIQHVVEAKAVVADLTGLNPNVFYELALRHATSKPIVLIAENGTQLPFDLAQMRTIFFSSADLESADQCRASIVDHLTESFSDPAGDSPVATAFQLQRLQQGNNVEKSVAELITTVEDLVGGMRQIQRYIELDAERFAMGSDEARYILHSLRSAATELANANVSDAKTQEDLLRQVSRLTDQFELASRRRRPYARSRDSLLRTGQTQLSSKIGLRDFNAQRPRRATLDMK